MANGSLEKNSTDVSESVPSATDAMEEMAAKLEKSEAGRKKLRLAINLLKEKVEASEKLLEANEILRKECEKERLAAESERNKAEEERRKRVQTEKEETTVKQQLKSVLQRLDAVEREYKSDRREIERMRKEVKQSVSGLGGVVKSFQDAQVSILDLERNFSEQVADAVSTSKTSSTVAQNAITDAKAAQRAAAEADRQLQSLAPRISALEDKNVQVEQRTNDKAQEQPSRTGGRPDHELKKGTLDYEGNGMGSLSAIHSKQQKRPTLRKVVPRTVNDFKTTPRQAQLDHSDGWKGNSATRVESSIKEQSAVTDSLPHLKVENGKPPEIVPVKKNKQVGGTFPQHPSNSGDRSKTCSALGATRLKERSCTSAEDQGVVVRGSEDSAIHEEDDRSAVSKCVIERATLSAKQDMSALSLLRDIQKVSQKERKYHARMERKLADFEKFLQVGADGEKAKPIFLGKEEHLPQKASRKRKKDSLDKSGKRIRTQAVEGKSSLTSGKSENLGHTCSEKEQTRTVEHVTLCQASPRPLPSDCVHPVGTSAPGTVELKPPNRELRFRSDDLYFPTCNALEGNVCPALEPFEVVDMESERALLDEGSHAYGFDSETSDDGLDWWLNRPALLSPTLPYIPSPMPPLHIEEPYISSANPASVEMTTEEADNLPDGGPPVTHKMNESVTVEAPAANVIVSSSELGSLGMSDRAEGRGRGACGSETDMEAVRCHRSHTRTAGVAEALENSCLKDLRMLRNRVEGQTSDTGSKLPDCASQATLAGSNDVDVVLDRGDFLTVRESCLRDESQSESIPRNSTQACVVDSSTGNESGLHGPESGLELSDNRSPFVNINGNNVEAQFCISDFYPGDSAIPLARERHDGKHSDPLDPQATTISGSKDYKGDVDLQSKLMTRSSDSELHAFKTGCLTGSEPVKPVWSGAGDSTTSYELGEGIQLHESDSSGLTKQRNDFSSTGTDFKQLVRGTNVEEDGKDLNLLTNVEVPKCVATSEKTPIVAGSLYRDPPNARVAIASASECGISLADTAGASRSGVDQENLLLMSHAAAVHQRESRSQLFCLELVFGHMMDGKISPKDSVEEVTESSEKIASICGIIQRTLSRVLNHGDAKCVHGNDWSSKVAIEVASVLLSSNLSHLDLLGVFTASLVDTHALWDAEKSTTSSVSEDRSLQLLIEIVKQVLATEVFQKTLPADQAFSSFANQLQRFLILGSITLSYLPDHRKHFGMAASSQLLFHFIPPSLPWKRLMSLISGSKLLAAFCEILGAFDFLRNCVYIVLRFCILDSSCLVAIMSSVASVCCENVLSLDKEDVLGQAIHLVISELLSELMSNENLAATAVNPLNKGDDNEEAQPQQFEYLIGESVNLPQLLGNLTTLRKVVSKSDGLSLDTLLTKLIELFTRPVSPDFSCQLGTDRNLFQRNLLIYPWKMKLNREDASVLYENKITESLSSAETEGTCNTLLGRTQVPDATNFITSPIECYWQFSVDGKDMHERNTSQLDLSERNAASTDKWKQMFHEVTSAMELLSSHLGWEWTYNSLIVERLWKLLGPGAQAMTAACVAHLFGRLGRLGRENVDLEFPGVDELRKNLFVILNSGTRSSELLSVSSSTAMSSGAVFRAQAAAAESLLLLATCTRKDMPDSGKALPEVKCPGMIGESVQHLRNWVATLEPEMQELLPLSLTSVFLSR